MEAIPGKILPGSRRPDGTYRKERRIRPGYTPQDEQPAYVSAGAAFMRAPAVRCPGYDAAADAAAAAAASAAPKSKAAKKNEKRKAAKKADGEAEGAAAAAAAAAGSSGAAVAAPAAAARPPAAAAATASASASAAPASSAAAAPSDGAPAAAPLSGPAATLDRQVKALSKKVRQCQALLARVADGGDALTAQEQEKVDKMAGWQREVDQLTAAMKQLC